MPSVLLCTTTGTISRDATRYNSRHNIWKSSTSVHQSASMARYSSRLPIFAKDALASHTRNTAIKKVTNAKDVKRYLNVATIARDGLLVVKRNDPLSPTRECIIVPRKVLDGLLTALHIQLDHPSSYQLKQIMHRYMCALDLDKSVETTSRSCHHCASLRNTPNLPSTQSTADPPEVVEWVSRTQPTSSNETDS